MFAEYLAETVCRILGYDLPPEPEREPVEVRKDDGCDSGMPCVLLEGLGLRRIGRAFREWLERPLDPLNPMQVGMLVDLEDRIEGLQMTPDSKSMEEYGIPAIMYASFYHVYFGTAYGSKFDAFRHTRDDPGLGSLIRMIEEAYLPAEVLERQRKEKSPG